MAVIETFLFDMDGVLCAYDFAGRLAVLEVSIGVSAAEIETRVFNSGFEQAADLGEFDSASYIAEISRILGVPVSAETWLAARAGAMTPDPEMIDLAASLKQHHEIALMTNNGPQLAEAIDDVFPALRDLFGERMFFSAEIKAGKEFAATFAKLMERLGWQPATTLFIDDSTVYTAAAAEAGLQTHLFRGIDGLRKALAEQGR